MSAAQPNPEPILASSLDPAAGLAGVRTARKLMEALADTAAAVERDQLYGQIWALRRLEHELKQRLEFAWGLAPNQSGDAA